MTPPLHIYLQDHFAGARYGIELLERCRRNNEGTEFAAPLAELASEIVEDRRTLLQIMREVGAEPSRAKVAAAWALEKAQRLKPNGRLVGYTPLTRLLELETLAIGIAGKKAMWRALEDVAERGVDLGPHEFSTLAGRADDQLRRVESLRLEAARMVFAPTGTARARPRTQA